MSFTVCLLVVPFSPSTLPLSVRHPACLELVHCIYLFLVAGAALGDSIQSKEPQVSGVEGGSVTFSCSYDTTDFSGIYLYWYRQSPKRAPQYILRRGTKVYDTYSENADFAQERFSSQAADSSTVLNITGLELSDAGVYLCALQRAHSAVGDRQLQTGAVPAPHLATREEADTCYMLDFRHPNTTKIFSLVGISRVTHQFMCLTPLGFLLECLSAIVSYNNTI
uniref:Ig-like domain-containing protein n=1 Tax=Gopherus evgoodei TaxID=1825980 RepID=A0A8C4Y643_9SAUR